MTDRLWLTVEEVLRIVDANGTRQEIERALIANLPRNGGPTPPDPMKVRTLHMGKRFAAVWLPQDFGAWRAYKGSGWRFLQLWRLRLAVKWSYK